MKNHNEINASQSTRNIGITLLGLVSALFFWHWIGAYSLIFSVLSGCATYANDVYFKNSPSKLDPLFSTIGGCIFIAFEAVRAHLW